MRPSTSSGRTEAHFGDRLPWQFALRQAQGERKGILGIVFPGSAPFDRLRANGREFWGPSFPGVHPSTGSGRTEAHFGDRLPRLCALRQAQGERKRILGSSLPAVHPSTSSGRTDYAVNGKAHTISVASPESSLRHRAEALCGIAQEPSEDAFRLMN